MYYSSVSHHREGTECANNIALHMQKALLAYRDQHGYLPARIIFYRDGVGDGQIQQIKEYEVEEIKKIFAKMYPENQPPQFLFTIVCKRINTRIFSGKARQEYENPPPGTVVDSTITLPERYDFFLISQSVRQGTVSPTSYNIIEDTFGLPIGKIQILTYKLCHLYYNWTGTTRLVSVLYFII
jgi:aubergine-like protein